jgi:hypothetical protein
MHRRGRQSFRRSEIPTCHPERHGTHNKSDILLVSSTFADPRLPPSPVAASFQLAVSPSHVAASFQLAVSPSHVAASFQLAVFPSHVAASFQLAVFPPDSTR